MYQIKGHALILAASALGVTLSAAVLDVLRPSAAPPATAAATAVPPVREVIPEPALKPLPASSAQSRYTRVLLSPADQEAMARDIQRELRRVGCFRGDVDGAWGPQSRQAMAAFTSQLKLRIPFEAPDESLLRLVQGQTQKVCGAPELDPEQAAVTAGAEPQPRLLQPPTEIKRTRRAPANGDTLKPPSDETQVAETVPPVAPRRLERASPPPSPNAPPAIVRNLMQTVNGVLAPLGF